MYARRPVMITLKYALFFIGMTVFLFIFYKFVPGNIVIRDYGTSGVPGIKYNDFIQYFYFLYDLMTGNMGYTRLTIYTGPVNKMILEMIPETILFIIITFFISFIISYYIGIYSGTTFRNTKNLEMNIFPLFIIYFIFSIVMLTVFSSILLWFPFRYIVQPDSLSNYIWITNRGNGIFTSTPTNIILIDAIIHRSGTVIYSYFRSLALPLISISAPTIIFLSTYINRITSIEYNKKYMKAGIIRDSFRDSYIIRMKKAIKTELLQEMKAVFAIYIGGVIIVSYVFSYMTLGYSLIYSFLNYSYGIFSGIYSLFFLSLIIIVFNYMIDLISGGDLHEN